MLVHEAENLAIDFADNMRFDVALASSPERGRPATADAVGTAYHSFTEDTLTLIPHTGLSGGFLRDGLALP